MNEFVLAASVGITGGCGAALRYLVDQSLTEILGARFPWGTMIVNLTGSLALGLLAGVVSGGPWFTILAMGLLGGYTTFSTANLEMLRLVREKRYAASLLHGPGMLLGCTALAVVGILITSG
ncbi:fluoride efflux transporter FluC [Natronoglycomyces albus]|uniref:Fluoride-specific ion channel FluC n=1 Tax=Natronoglycomyces albus TaxID=2811108 RepID=A0A895XKQ7_9ACTN|nr:CrcB family protein [Natronoglycomyces albus]QSB05647.1 CrcB family protein [Natronoglycomyces albus]